MDELLDALLDVLDNAPSEALIGKSQETGGLVGAYRGMHAEARARFSAALERVIDERVESGLREVLASFERKLQERLP